MDEGTPIVPTSESRKLDLINCCIAGDEEAWRRFYNEYARSLPTFIRDYRLSPDSTEQVVHDFMAHLFMKRCAVLGSYRLVAGARFESWLRIVFRRFTLRWLRTAPITRWDLPLDPVEAIERQQPQKTSDPSVVLAIYRVLDRLEGREAPLVGMLLEGHPYDEIGRRLGMKEPAVAVAVQRLRAKLRRLLSNVGLDSPPPGGFSSKKAPAE